jgi:hypothetical protein
MSSTIEDETTYELDGQVYDVIPVDATLEEVAFPGFVATRNFSFNNTRFHTGDPITVAVRKHYKFEALLASGNIKAV